MTSPARALDLVLCLTPCGEPDAGLTAAGVEALFQTAFRDFIFTEQAEEEP